MRTVASGSFHRLTSVAALWDAWLAYSRGKRRRPRVAQFDLDADTYICRMHRQLRSAGYRPGPYRVWIIRDPKVRAVAAPSMSDRIVQRALLDEIAPVYERGFVPHSYAVCTGRGVQRAVLAYMKWSRRYRYRLTLDIRRYFLSIRHATLLELFAHRLRDRRTLGLIQSMIAAGGEVYRTGAAIRALGLREDPVSPGRGLPLGGYLSHWAGGLYLDGLDHFVTRTVKIPGYLRYMDDFVLFADDVEALEDARCAVAEWLARERGLAIKPRRDQVQSTRQPSTYLGFRVSRAGVLPGPKARRRLRARLQQVDSMGMERLAMSLQAYRGMMMSV